MARYAVRDIKLAPSGRAKIEWVSRFMPVLNAIREEFEKSKPFQGLRIACSLHLEMKTAYLAEVLKAGGAEVAVCGANILTTQDDVAAALAAAAWLLDVVRMWGMPATEKFWEAVSQGVKAMASSVSWIAPVFLGLLGFWGFLQLTKKVREDM